MSLLAIDSGYPECACAVAGHGKLRWVGSVEYGAMLLPGYKGIDAFDAVIVEIPTVRGTATPNPEDLILVGVSGARLAERFAAIPSGLREVRPAEWKGNTPKPPHHRRMWDALADSEKQLLGGAKTLAAIDAACLRGARDRWSASGATYYRARELPTVNGTKITHDVLDASALALYALGRIRKG